MERIQAAIQKAKEQRASAGPAAGAPAMPAPGAAAVAPPQPGGAWARLPAFSPDPDRMAREHIVCFDRSIRCT